MQHSSYRVGCLTSGNWEKGGEKEREVLYDIITTLYRQSSSYGFKPQGNSLGQADEILVFGINVGELYVKEQQDLHRANTL